MYYEAQYTNKKKFNANMHWTQSKYADAKTAQHQQTLAYTYKHIILYISYSAHCSITVL